MTSDGAFDAPVHAGVTPSPLRFSTVDGAWLRQALPDLAIVAVDKAEGDGDGDGTGYYRLTLADGGRLFAKVKSGDRAAREAKAARLSSELERLGAPSLAAERTLANPRDGLNLFVYPWVEQVFYDESLEGTTNLGDALAVLHGKMRALPSGSAPGKHLFGTWEDRLSLLPGASFGEDYRRLLSGAGEAFARTPGQIAHNDIHRGNVLFKATAVAAFIDFEDAVETTSSPLVDIAASLERFCLLPSPSEEKARAFITGYRRASGGAFDASPSEIVRVGLCRCYHAITILELSKAPENPLWTAERGKFEALLVNWFEWENVISSAFQTTRV